MSRGIQGINLNTGQDFGGPFQELIQLVGSEIESDLEDAVATLEAWLWQHDSADELPSRDARLEARADQRRRPRAEMVRTGAAALSFADGLRSSPRFPEGHAASLTISGVCGRNPPAAVPHLEALLDAG